jgi:hypothetical protein
MDYQPPVVPPIQQIRTFEDVRTALQTMLEYLHHLNAMQAQYFTHLAASVNAGGFTEGAPLAAAPTITPNQFMHAVTGTATVTNVTQPYGHQGQLMLISKDGFYLATGGNISLVQSPNYLGPGAHIVLTWIPSQKMWFADTCRLKTAPGIFRAGGRVEST